MKAFETFPTPHGFLVLHERGVVAGPFATKGEAVAWIAGRAEYPEPVGAWGALLGGGLGIAGALALAGAAFAIAENLPAIGGGLILIAFASFLLGR